MSFKYDFQKNKTQRISLVRFNRNLVSSLPPKLNNPEIDDRGYFREEIITSADQRKESDTNLGSDRGPVVGVTEDDIVFVELERIRIDKKAQLFVTSSNPDVMNVSTRAIQKTPYQQSVSDKLLNFETQELQITGVKGSGGVLPKVAKVEIRYGSNQGVIIGELTVFVFTRIYVNIVPHLVNLRGEEGYSVAYIFDIEPVMKMIQAIWQPCGIFFFVGAPEQESMQSNINKAGKWADEIGGHSQFEEMFKQAVRHHTEAINLYFVDEIISDYGTLAYTERPGTRKFRRGVIAQTNVETLSDLAIAIAHELGHFLGLEHTDKRIATDTRDDIWSVDRMLMFPMVSSFSNARLLAMKNLYDWENPDINHITDPEWQTARTTCNSNDGAYK